MWKTCVKHVFSCVKHVSLYVKTRVKITCLLVFYRFHFHVFTRYFYTCLHVKRHVFFTCLQVQRHVFFTCFTRKISCWGRSTPIETIQFESNIYPLNTVTKNYVVKYFFKVYSLPINHIIHKLFREQIDNIENLSWNTLSHKSPLLKRALEICNNLNIPLDFIRENDFNLDRFIPPVTYYAYNTNLYYCML